MLKKGDTIGLICCSNGKDLSEKKKIEHLINVLDTKFQLTCVLTKTLYSTSNRSPKERAAALLDLYTNTTVKAIFDLSGGDLANELLPYLNFETIKTYPKPFIGYSDLTVVLNSIYKKTGLYGINYQLLNILNGTEEQRLFEDYFFNADKLPNFYYSWLTYPGVLQTVVIGGNIRCLLKLAGTPYFPDPTNRVLLLEARGGSLEQIATYLAQLDQMGVLNSCAGILLGQFTSIEERAQTEALIQLILSYTSKYNKIVLKTACIGHSKDSIPFPIGKKISFI